MFLTKGIYLNESMTMNKVKENIPVYSGSRA